MKKILYSTLALFIALPMVASAATFSFSPSSGSFAPGETFDVVVYLNPSAGEEITTAKLSSLFTVNGLEVVSFSQADGWIPLAVPGSDLTDNTAGKLIKTGGFPSRVTALKQFGTISLKAKGAGTATISIEGDSMILDSVNVNKYTASAGASFIVEAPTPTPVAAPVTTPTEVSGTVIESEQTEEEPATNEATTTDDVIATSTSQQEQSAAVIIVDTSANNFWYYLIALIVILAGVLMWRKRR
jgi:hypothetical protein